MKKLVFLTLMASLYGCFARTPEKTGLEGELLPSFKLLLPDSATYFNMMDVPAGKPLVLFYFGAYCPYSRAQMEEIVKDINKLKNIDFYVFTAGPFNEMKDFYKYYQLNKYTNITTGLDCDAFFGSHFKANLVPYTIIYGKDKKLKAAFIGKVTTQQIKKFTEK